jgi:predicted DNA-binding protein (MmcQ/YjbR family)
MVLKTIRANKLLRRAKPLRQNYTRKRQLGHFIMRNVNDFLGREVIPAQLRQFGFKKKGDGYYYQRPILDDQFLINVCVCGDKVTADVYDVFAEDNYYLHLVEDAEGSFVGQIRTEYEKLLEELSACFKPAFPFGEVGKAVSAYARRKYHSNLEFLWKDENTAILRHIGNKKWYAVFMCVQKKKLGLDGDDLIPIIDMRAPKHEISSLVDNINYFRGWHMNKQSWITIPLDGRVSADVVCWFLDMSHDISAKTKGKG